MIYVVKNKKTSKEYTVDEKTYKGLDMKKKYSLVHSFNEKEKNIPIPEEIIIKEKSKKIKKESEND